MANAIATYQIGFKADTAQLKKSLDETLSILNKLGKKNSLVSGLEEAGDAAFELSRILKSSINTNTGLLDITTLRDNINLVGGDLRQYALQLEKLGAEGQDAFYQVARAIVTAEDPLRRSGKLMNSLWENMEKVVKYQFSYKTLNLFTGSLRAAYEYSQDLNESLNKIKIVTGNSSEEMAKFAEKANNAAKALSTTTTAYTDASYIYALQGLNAEEMEKRTAITIKMSQVTGDSAEDVSSYMTAIWNNFYDGSKSLEYFGDVLTKLGSTTASTTSEIADGLERFASLADTVGLSYEYATASLATIVAETRRSADTVGTALNAIFTRLQGLKLGEELDDGTDLNKYSKALETVGISIKDTTGQVKDLDTILNELGSRWKTLAKDEQIALAQTVAGQRQYATLIALMDNWDKVLENITAAGGSTGELNRQADDYAESWKAARDEVKAAAEGVYDSLIDSDILINANKSLASFLGIIENVIDGLGGMNGLLSTTGSILTRVFSDKIAQTMREMVTNTKIMLGLEKQKSQEYKNQTLAILDELKPLETASDYENAQIVFLKEEIKLRQTIEQNRDRMSANTRKILEEGISQLTQMQNYSLELLKLQDSLSLKSQDSFAKLETVSQEINKILNSFNDEVTPAVGYSKPTNEFRQTFNKFIKDSFPGLVQADSFNTNSFTIEITPDLKFTNLKGDKKADYGKNFKQYATVFKDLSKYNANLELFRKSWDGVGQEIDENIPKFKQVLSVFKVLSQEEIEQINSVEDLNYAYRNATEYFDRTKEAVRILNEYFQSDTVQSSDSARTAIDNLNKELEEYIKNLVRARNANLDYLNVQDQNQNSTQVIEGFNKTLENKATLPEKKDWASYITQISNSLFSFYSVIQALDNLPQIFKNEDLSAGEKLLQTVMSLGQVLQGFSGQVIMLKRAEDAQAIAQKNLNAVIAQGGTEVEKAAAKTLLASQTIQASLGWISLVITAVMSAVRVIKYLFDYVDQQRQKEIEQQRELYQNRLEEIDQVQGLIENYYELEKVYSETGEGKEELLETIEKLNEKLNLESVQVDLLAGRYSHLTEQIREAEKAQREQKIKELEVALAVEDQAFKAKSSDDSTMIGSNISGTLREKDIIKNSDLWKEYGMSPTSPYKSWNFLIAAPEDAKEAREQLQLYKELQNNLTESGETNGASFNLVTSKIKELEELLETYNELFDQRSNEKLNQIRENFNFNPTSLKEYKESMAEAEKTAWKLIKDGELTQEQWEAEKIALSNNNEQLQKYSTLLTIGEEYRKKFFKDIDLTELEDRLDAEQLQIVLQAILDEDSLVEVQNRINQSYAEAYYSRLNTSREDLETVALNSNTSGEISEEDWEILKNNSDFMEAVEEKYGELKNLQHQSIAEQLEFVNSVYVATQKLSYDSLQMLEDTYNKEYNIISQKISDLEQLQANGNTYLKELGNLRVRAAKIETEQDLQEVETLLKNIKKRANEEAGIDISWLNLDNLNEVDLSELYHKLDEAKEKILDLGDQKIELSLDWNDYDALAGTFEQIENFAADIKDETKLVGDNYTYASSEMRKWLSIYPELFSQAIELENGLMGLNKEMVDAFVEGQRTEAKSAIDNQIEQWKTQKEAAEARKEILEKTLEAFTESKKGELEVSKLDATQKGLISQRLSDYLIENGWSVEKAHAEAIKIMGGDYFDFAKYIGDEIIDPTYNNWGTMLDQLPIDTVTTLQRMADSWRSFANGLNSVTKAVQAAVNGLDTNITVDFNFNAPNIPKIHPLLLKAIKPLNLDAGGNSPYGPNDGSAGQDGGLPSYVRQFNIGDLLEDFKSDYINSLNTEIANTQFEIDTLNAKILHAKDRLNNPLGTFDKDKNGGGKDSSKSPDQKEVEDTFEKYHEITREIEYQEKALQKLEKQADRTYGLDKLKSYAQQQEKLNKLEELQNDKLKLASTYLAGDQAILEGYGMQLNIDPETKEIKNFTSLKEQALKEYQDYLKKYNAMTPDQQEAVKEELEAQGKLYEEKLKMLDEYEKDLDEAREIEEKLIEIRQQKRDKRIIEITEVLRVKLDVKSVEDAADDFTKIFRESWGDYLDYGNQSRDIDASKAKREKGLLDDYKNQYVDLLNELKNPIDLNTETVVEKLKELQNNIISSGESLIEWARNLREVVPQALEAAQERFSKFTNQLQHNTTIASSIKDLLELQRIVTKTGKGFDLVQKAQIAGYQANLVSAKLNKQRADEAYKNLVLAEEALANEAEGTYSYEILKNNRDALLAEFNSAQEALLEASKSALEDAKTYYLNAIEEAAYQADLIFSKGEGLDLLSDKLNNYLDEEEMYLDVVNEAYEADKWNNKLQNDIDNARDKRTKQMYEDLQKELEIRRGNNELSEYDLDIMDAKYKMLQAQIALEDAQNNKTTLRLVRDRQGNWNYQYTANEDEVDKAQQDLADAQNEWYNIAKRRNKELAQESVEVTQQMMSDLTELYRNKDTMPEEEFLRRKEEIIRHATEKMIAISRERQIAEEDMTEAGKLTITDFENHYAGSLKHLGVDLNDFEQGLDDFERKATEAVGEYGKMTNKVVDEVGIGYDDLNAILNTTTESTKKVSEEGNKAVTTMWKQIEAAREQTQSFRELANEIQRVASELNNLSNQAAQTIKITSKVPTETGAISPSTGGTDLSMQAALAFKNAGYEVTPEVESLLKKRQEKIDSLSPEEREKLRKQNPNGWLRSSDDILKILLAAQTDGSAARDLVNQILQGLVYFDTGGYTGSFDNAKLAFLHEKELVLNQEDTENILKTVNIIREFENILDNRAKISSQLASTQLDANLHLLTLQMQKADRPIAQNIEINAEFPDVQAASEIEAAFDNLLNRASQYINIKGK